MDPQAPQPTQKQQVTELLKQASNVVITASNVPDADQIAAVIACSDILTKLGKRVEAVISRPLPQNLRFLKSDRLSQKFEGERDFVIELDTAKTEADKLKYIPEDGKLKIYITPFNGNFTKEQVSFNYGEYHCDVLIAFGAADKASIDNALAGNQDLLKDTTVITVMAGQTSSDAAIAWNDPAASSICEMLMSITEALQGGLLDQNIATSLLTGIVAKTNHFTAINTTPKVMTMAAQLMAAGARQAEVMQNLAKISNTPQEFDIDRSKKSATKTSAQPKATAKPTNQPKPSAKKAAAKTGMPDVAAAVQAALAEEPALASNKDVKLDQPAAANKSASLVTKPELPDLDKPITSKPAFAPLDSSLATAPKPVLPPLDPVPPATAGTKPPITDPGPTLTQPTPNSLPYANSANPFTKPASNSAVSSAPPAPQPSKEPKPEPHDPTADIEAARKAVEQAATALDPAQAAKDHFDNPAVAAPITFPADQNQPPAQAFTPSTSTNMPFATPPVPEAVITPPPDLNTPSAN